MINAISSKQVMKTNKINNSGIIGWSILIFANKHHKNCKVDGKENYQWDLGNFRVSQFFLLHFRHVSVFVYKINLSAPKTHFSSFIFWSTLIPSWVQKLRKYVIHNFYSDLRSKNNARLSVLITLPLLATAVRSNLKHHFQPVSLLSNTGSPITKN